MKTLLNPLKLFGALTLLFLKLAGYTITFAVQTIAFLIQRKPEMVSEAFGWYGREVTNAVTAMFKS